MTPDATHELLLGLLALQCGFISKDQLVSAFSVWMSDKSRSLLLILKNDRALSEHQQALLSALVVEHLKQHNNDAEQSLASLSSVREIKAELAQLGDASINATLVNLRAESPDQFVTIKPGGAGSVSNRFIVIRPHARGGLGMVSVAVDNELNRQVALKEILPRHADDRLMQQRFVQEAEITGQLEHPGIVPIYGLGNYSDGRPYYAMRFVDGENLKNAIAAFHKDRSVSFKFYGESMVKFRNLLGRFVDVCHAIEYAHSRHVLHRDLKPDNILIGPYGETLVVDWGLATTVSALSPSSVGSGRPVKLRSESNDLLEGSAVGTPAYMSPEQAAGKLSELGPASDVYALGATLYCLLSGRAPVVAESISDVLEKVRRGEIESPQRFWSHVPKPLEKICSKAMSLRPSDRYASAKCLADDIERWLADEPVQAWREGLGLRMMRFARHHRASLAALLITLSVTTLVATSAALVINHYRIREQTIRNVVQDMATEFQLAQARARTTQIARLERIDPKAIENEQRERTAQLAAIERQLERLVDAETRAWLYMRKGDVLRTANISDRDSWVQAKAAFNAAADIFRKLPGLESSEQKTDALLASLQWLAEASRELGTTSEVQASVKEGLSITQKRIANDKDNPKWELWHSRFSSLGEPGSRFGPKAELAHEQIAQTWKSSAESMERIVELPWPDDAGARGLRLDAIRSQVETLVTADRGDNLDVISPAASAAIKLIEQVIEHEPLPDQLVWIDWIQLTASMASIEVDSDRMRRILDLQIRLIDKQNLRTTNSNYSEKVLQAVNVCVSSANRVELRKEAIDHCRWGVELAKSLRQADASASSELTEFKQQNLLADLLEESQMVDELRRVEKEIVALGAGLEKRSALTKEQARQLQRRRERLDPARTQANDDPFKL